MSTRSQIRFITRWEKKEGETIEEVSQVYRHSDGYPSGVLPDLKRLYEIQEETGTQRGGSYSAANFIFLGKLGGMNWYAEEDRLNSTDPEDWDLNQPLFLLGHGVEDPRNGIHGDEEYLYEIVEERDGRHGERERKIRVSKHDGFPRWGDDDTEKAFELAEWQFEGTLEEAVSHFCED